MSKGKVDDRSEACIPFTKRELNREAQLTLQMAGKKKNKKKRKVIMCGLVILNLPWVKKNALFYGHDHQS